jgi:multicomponent Na+:H+ antiporter subunit A
VLWKALWPVLLGAVLAIALWRWWRSMPRIPKGDVIVELAGGKQMAVRWGKALERMDSVLRQWPTASVSLLILTIALGVAVFAR